MKTYLLYFTQIIKYSVKDISFYLLLFSFPIYSAINFILIYKIETSIKQKNVNEDLINQFFFSYYLVLILIIVVIIISHYFIYSVSKNIIYDENKSFIKYFTGMIIHTLKSFPIGVVLLFIFYKLFVFIDKNYTDLVNIVASFFTIFLFLWLIAGYSCVISRGNSKKSFSHSINFIFTKFFIIIVPIIIFLFLFQLGIINLLNVISNDLIKKIITIFYSSIFIVSFNIILIFGAKIIKELNLIEIIENKL